MNGWRIAHPSEILHGGGVALACALDGSMSADELHGLFAADTRVLSTYRLSLGGVGLELLTRMRGTARHAGSSRTGGSESPTASSTPARSLSVCADVSME
jgi:hypothetical protein